MRSNEVINEIGEIKKREEKIKRKDIKYKANNYYMIFNNLKQ